MNKVTAENVVWSERDSVTIDFYFSIAIDGRVIAADLEGEIEYERDADGTPEIADISVNYVVGTDRGRIRINESTPDWLADLVMDAASQAFKDFY